MSQVSAHCTSICLCICMYIYTHIERGSVMSQVSAQHTAPLSVYMYTFRMSHCPSICIMYMYVYNTAECTPHPYLSEYTYSGVTSRHDTPPISLSV